MTPRDRVWIVEHLLESVLKNESKNDEFRPPDASGPQLSRNRTREELSSWLTINSLDSSLRQILICTGFFTTLISASCLLGICLKSNALLYIYLVPTCLVFFFIVGVIGLLNFHPNSIFMSLRYLLARVFVENYTLRKSGTVNSAFTILWEHLQERHNCCGAISANDFHLVSGFNSVASRLPLSCCAQQANCTLDYPFNHVKYSLVQLDLEPPLAAEGIYQPCFPIIWDYVKVYFGVIVYILVSIDIYLFGLACLAIHVIRVRIQNQTMKRGKGKR
ncbi:unnamed protein product [Protopolystoma xenopodis]|uniref:Tetraspanin n=1 Tax=Protopolystoma xenopodis TaxID=117903 RepID=A0A3S5FEU0_9PLAT|nr:unnamed protein product [Protopolystoma xenopodis]